MNSTEAQAQQEVAQVVRIVEELTGLSSRWSGQVELVPGAQYRGQKSFSCHISIRASLAQDESRWMTFIHEALHSVSAGFVGEDYRSARGWEEGVVEQLQRLFRAEVLDRLGVHVEEAVFAEAEGKYLYNLYIEYLEQLRQLLQDEPEGFYLDLLRTPIKARAARIYARGSALGLPQGVFIRIFSTASATMRDKLTGDLL